jgi:hypothetical protein
MTMTGTPVIHIVSHVSLLKLTGKQFARTGSFLTGTGKFGSKNRRMKFSAHTGLGTGVRVSGIVSSADAGASYSYVLFLLCARRQSVIRHQQAQD